MKTVVVYNKIEIDSTFRKELAIRNEQLVREDKKREENFLKILPYALQLSRAVAEVHNALISNGREGILKNTLFIDELNTFVQSIVNKPEEYFKPNKDYFGIACVQMWLTEPHKMKYTTNKDIQIIYGTKGYYSVEDVITQLIKDRLR